MPRSHSIPRHSFMHGNRPVSLPEKIGWITAGLFGAIALSGAAYELITTAEKGDKAPNTPPAYTQTLPDGTRQLIVPGHDGQLPEAHILGPDIVTSGGK